MKLVIAEKPSVAQEIAKFLSAAERKNSYLKGNGYIVSWCYGHLISLAQPQDYDERYKKWNLEDLPIVPINHKLTINDETKEHFYMLKNLMAKDDVKEIICATDSGREGELIFRLVYEMANCKKPVKRLWVSSLTEESIKAGFANLRDIEKYNNLYEAGLKRAIADWLVGMNATRMYSLKYGNKITVGRVQTPTLAMIVNRDDEISKFKKEKYYTVRLSMNDCFNLSTDRIDDKSAAEKLLGLIGDNIEIKDVIQKEKKTNPELPFDLTTLQRECNKFFGYSAKQTLDYAQSLYEKKLITYPRTDSRYLTEDMITSTVNNILGENYFDTTRIKVVFNSKKVTEHHAIIPTISLLKEDLLNVSDSEAKVYRLISNKLNASVGYPLIENTTKVVAEFDGFEFTSTGKVIKDEGFTKYLKEYRSKKNEDTVLPHISIGDVIDIANKEIKEKYTTPPKHFTEDTLLKAMEIAGSDALEKGVEVELKGLGTPATRASVIEKLINVGYIERNSKNIVSTQKGINAIKIVDKKIKSPKLTAEWEIKLQKIEKGNYNSTEFLNEIKEFTQKFINENCVDANIKREMYELNEKSKNKDIIGDCPKCKNNVYESEKNFYCSKKDCNFALFKEDKFFKGKKTKLTKAKAKVLLKNGQVKFEKLYSENKDKYYSADISFEVKDKYINYKLIF